MPIVMGNTSVGDSQSGNIYIQSVGNLTDNGQAINRVRRAPYIAVEHEWVFHNQLELLCETGLPSNLTGASNSPTVYYVPDQQGQTWEVLVIDNGEYQIKGPVTNGPQTIIVGDNQVSGQNWQIIVALNAANQNVLATLQVYQNGPLSFPIATTPSLLQSTIYVAGGQVQTSQGVPAQIEPKVSMRFSDDGGHTWSNFKTLGLGLTGNFRKRVVWRRLGRSRNRVYEISCSDAYSLRLIDAFINADPEMKPQPRLNDRLRGAG